jgi:Fe-S cluster biosynthesis and repair protein YggX
VHNPIGDRTTENLAGNTGERSFQTPYTPRTHKIPDIKATGMENKDTKEGAWNDGTRSTGIQDAQDDIGWDKFMLGNISVLWQDIQAQYFQEIGKQNSGLRWTSALIQRILQMAWDQWKHRNAILHNSENLVTQTEGDDRISCSDGTGNWKLESNDYFKVIGNFLMTVE